MVASDLARRSALRLVAIGPEVELTRWCAEQCLLGTGLRLLDVLAVDDGRRRVEQAQRLLDLLPELVLLTGGVEGGDNTWLADMLDLLLAVRPRLAPQLIYAGNSQAASLVQAVLGTGALLLANPYPEPGVQQFAPVRAALTALAAEQEPAAGLGAHAPAQLGAALTPEQAIRELWVHLGGENVLVATRRGETVSRTSSPFGLGSGMLVAAEQIVPERLAGRLGQPIDRREWLDFCGNRYLSPAEAPRDSDLPLLRAVAAELLHLALACHLSLHPGQLAGLPALNPRWWEKLGPLQPPPVMPTQVVAEGKWLTALTETPEQVVSILLDGLQPEGVTELYQISQAGAADRAAPVGAPPALGARLLTTAICPFGLPATGKVALTVLCEPLPLEQLRVRSGEQVTIGWLKDKSLELEFRPEREVDLGAGPGRSVRRIVCGGVTGLVVDCRGRRPLPPSALPPRRAAGSRLPRKGGAAR